MVKKERVKGKGGRKKEEEKKQEKGEKMGSKESGLNTTQNPHAPFFSKSSQYRQSCGEFYYPHFADEEIKD